MARSWRWGAGIGGRCCEWRGVAWRGASLTHLRRGGLREGGKHAAERRRFFAWRAIGRGSGGGLEGVGGGGCGDARPDRLCLVAWEGVGVGPGRVDDRHGDLRHGLAPGHVALAPEAAHASARGTGGRPERPSSVPLVTHRAVQVDVLQGGGERREGRQVRSVERLTACGLWPVGGWCCAAVAGSWWEGPPFQNAPSHPRPALAGSKSSPIYPTRRCWHMPTCSVRLARTRSRAPGRGSGGQAGHREGGGEAVRCTTRGA